MLAAALVSGAGLVRGQENALFINENGNVGINTAQPQGFQVQLPESSKPSATNPGVTLSGGAEGNANIELRNKGTGTPYIDFSQSTTADYDARIRLTEPGKLVVEGATVKAKSFETDAGVSLAAIQNAVNMLMPIGTIMAYGGDTSNKDVVQQLVEQGWLPCDGREVQRQDYVDLFNVINTSYGAGNALTTFQVPDFRGRFLRGADQGTKRDPDAGSRRAEANGNSGDKVGSVQDDAFKAHRHTIKAQHAGYAGGASSGDPPAVAGWPKNPADKELRQRGAQKPGPKMSTSIGSSRQSTCFHWFLNLDS